MYPDIGSGCRSYATGHRPKTARSLTSMIFRTSRPPRFGGFCLSYKAFGYVWFNKKQKGIRKMKIIQLKTTAFAVLTVCTLGNTAHGALSMDMCFDACKSKVTSLLPCCCPTGTKVTTYDCPSGWNININNTECSRPASTGSDTKGTYTQNYGTCAPTTGTCDGYKLSERNTGSSSGAVCFCQGISV